MLGSISAMKTCVECGKEYDDRASYCAVDGTALAASDGSDLIGRVVGDK